MKKRMKKSGKVLLVCGIVAVLVISWFVYVGDYYHSQTPKEYLNDSQAVTVTEKDGNWFFDGEGTEDALIFYPGAKVEPTSYAPLLYRCAEAGIDCYLVSMPENLAFFGKNKATQIMDANDYEHWYLAGHSLGGAMAEVYAAEHAEQLDGLIFLAAFGTKDISDTTLSVLSIYGSEDGILNMEKVETGRALMPEQYEEVCIQGGNHAGFGDYGHQNKDGESIITNEQQQEETVAAILDFLAKDR